MDNVTLRETNIWTVENGLFKEFGGTSVPDTIVSNIGMKG